MWAIATVDGKAQGEGVHSKAAIMVRNGKVVAVSRMHANVNVQAFLIATNIDIPASADSYK